MRAIEVAVGVDHFGFEPQAEFHAKPSHMVDQWTKSIGIDIPRNRPVTQTRTVMAAATEPAIIQNKALHADLRCAGGKLLQFFDIMVEIDGFPSVIVDRTRFAAHCRPKQFGAHMVMELAAELAEPLSAIGRDNLRTCICLPRRKPHFAGQRQCTKAHQPPPIG